MTLKVLNFFYYSLLLPKREKKALFFLCSFCNEFIDDKLISTFELKVLQLNHLETSIDEIESSVLMGIFGIWTFLR